MSRLKNGAFSLDVKRPAGYACEFRFVIDGGRWEYAWNADKYVGRRKATATTRSS